MNKMLQSRMKMYKQSNDKESQMKFINFIEKSHKEIMVKNESIIAIRSDSEKGCTLVTESGNLFMLGISAELALSMINQSFK